MPLTATVRTCPERRGAERHGKRVADVPAIVKDLKVRLPSFVQRLDPEQPEDVASRAPAGTAALGGRLLASALARAR